MVATGAILKSLYPKLFYVTCESHLMRNGAMKVKFLFEDVDKQIAIVKSAAVKEQTHSNQTR